MHEQPTLSQQTVVIKAETQLPEFREAQDITIVVLEGQGNLTLSEETISLKAGQLIFIPADMSHQLSTQTHLTFLLSRCESEPAIEASAWVIHL